MSAANGTPSNATSMRKPVIHVGLSTLAKLALGLLPIPILTRTLGLEGYGAYVVLVSIIGFSLIGQVGLAPATIFRISGGCDQSQINRTVTNSFALLLALGVCLSLILVALVPVLGALFFPPDAREAMVLPLYVTCGVIPIQFIRNWVMAVGAGSFRYDLQASSEVIGAGILSLGTASLALLGLGVTGLITWVLVSTFLTALLHFVLLRRSDSLRPMLKDLDGAEILRLLRFGSAYWAVTIGQVLFGQVDRLLVGLLIGLDSVGLYGAATQVASKINTISGAPVQVISPGISRLRATGADDGAREMFRKSLSIVNGIALLLAVGTIFAAPFIAMVLVPGRATQREFTIILGILALTYGIHSMAAPGFFGALGIGKPSLSAKWILISGMCVLVGITLTAEAFGLPGAAWSNIAFTLAFAVTLNVGKELDLAIRTILWKFIGVAGLMGAAFIASHILITTGSSLPTTAVVGSLFVCLTFPFVLRSDYRVLRG